MEVFLSLMFSYVVFKIIFDATNKLDRKERLDLCNEKFLNMEVK